MRVRLLLIVFGLSLVGLPPMTAQAAPPTHSCPASLAAWQTLLGAGWLDCHQLPDLTTTNNAFTDPNTLTGMGFPPPGSGTLNSKSTNPASPAVPGIQIDGWFADDTCNAYQAEPALTSKSGAAFIAGCTAPPGGTCATGCHHDGQFVIRIPDSWDGHIMTAGTPGIRDAFSSDLIWSDYAMEHGWAYVSQDKGNMGANFYRDGCDEAGGCAPGTPTWSGACTSAATPWCPMVAIQEWTYRVRQATQQAKALLATQLSAYGLAALGKSYVVGVSNGGYQVRRALETDTTGLYDGGVDWEGTLFLPSMPAGVTRAASTVGYNLFGYLPTAIQNATNAINGDATAIAALAAVGFNPESQPLWAYHEAIYWGLTQKVYRLETDPEYTNYTCSGSGTPCVSPAAEVVPAGDPDALYNYEARVGALPAVATRLASVANTGDIHHPLITLHGDQDALLPIKTDSDLYSQMVGLAGHSATYRYYTVRGGNHVDGQFDDHNGVDTYGNTLLRPILPCARAAVDAMTSWVEAGTAPPASHPIPRDPNASAADLANRCDLAATSTTSTTSPTPTPTPSSGATGSTTPASGTLPFSGGPGRPLPLLPLGLGFAGAALVAAAVLGRRLRRR